MYVHVHEMKNLSSSMVRGSWTDAGILFGVEMIPIKMNIGGNQGMNMRNIDVWYFLCSMGNALSKGTCLTVGNVKLPTLRCTPGSNIQVVPFGCGFRFFRLFRSRTGQIDFGLEHIHPSMPSLLLWIFLNFFTANVFNVGAADKPSSGLPRFTEIY